MAADSPRNTGKVTDNIPPAAPSTSRAPAPAPEKPPERERLRDYIIVFVAAPLTPTKASEKLTDKKPWLEFVSTLLKVALAAYALYEAVG